MNERVRLGLGQRLFVALQYALPQHLLSGLVFHLTRLRLGPVTQFAIRAFTAIFRVNMHEAAASHPGDYPSFNAFFTRALRDGARPLDPRPEAVLSPVDGVVSQLGVISAARILQAKGRDYSVAELLGGDVRLAESFDGGAFATLYLAPRDYHRIHMPVDGRLRESIHVPGRLFSVNLTTAAAVPRLFARIERLVCSFDTDLGPMALVLVGAIFVGSIETIWSGLVTPPRARELVRRRANAGMPVLQRGTEMGRFNMGSTVILLLPRDRVRWDPAIAPGAAVRCGSALGLWRSRHARAVHPAPKSQ